MTTIDIFTTTNGQTVTLRYIHKDDASLLVDMFHRLSPETKRLRFHLYTTKIPDELIQQTAQKLSDLSPELAVAVVAIHRESGGMEHAVGVARLARKVPSDTEAEVAVVVRDDFQRKGLGKHLLITLANKARQMGITHFSAWVMADNVRLMKLIRGLELKSLESEMRHGEIKIKAPIN